MAGSAAEVRLQAEEAAPLVAILETEEIFDVVLLSS